MQYHLYDGPAAERWFKERGLKLSASYLRKLRCLGTGPAYVIFNGRPYYTDETLTDYVAERTSAPARSEAEHVAAGHRGKWPPPDVQPTTLIRQTGGGNAPRSPPPRSSSLAGGE
jgi:hypothetical protein